MIKWDGYNNVGVCAVALMSVLEHVNYLSLPKALLIMPLVMHDETISFLSKKNIASREAAALVAVRPNLFANFPDRFDVSLAVTINAIQFLVVTGFIYFDDGIKLKKPLNVDNTFGLRAAKIVKATKNIALLLASPVDELYLNFRVKL